MKKNLNSGPSLYIDNILLSILSSKTNSQKEGQKLYIIHNNSSVYLCFTLVA